MKKLLTFGCSYTDDKYIELTSKYPQLIDLLKDNDGNMTKPFPFWPELLSKRLNMKYENYAQCGFGNDGIHSTFMDEITRHDNIGLVVVMWSEFMRIGFEQEIRSIFSSKFDWLKINITASDRNKKLRKRFEYVFKSFDYILLGFQEKYFGINNIKYFKNKINIKNKKNILIEKNSNNFENHYYIFSKRS